jgi:hypothetical protein
MYSDQGWQYQIKTGIKVLKEKELHKYVKKGNCLDEVQLLKFLWNIKFRIVRSKKTQINRTIKKKECGL